MQSRKTKTFGGKVVCIEGNWMANNNRSPGSVLKPDDPCEGPLDFKVGKLKLEKRRSHVLVLLIGFLFEYMSRGSCLNFSLC